MSPVERQLVAELRSAYHESGLTYVQIAARAEMGPATVYRTLNGRQKVQWASFVRLCEALGRRVRVEAA